MADGGVTQIRWWFCVAMVGSNVNGCYVMQFQANCNGGFVVRYVKDGAMVARV